jgi:hypothetical protein
MRMDHLEGTGEPAALKPGIWRGGEQLTVRGSKSEKAPG